MNIIPKPQYFKEDSNSFFLFKYNSYLAVESGVFANNRLPIQMLQKFVLDHLGIDLGITNQFGKKGDFLFELDQSYPEQKYMILIRESNIILKGKNDQAFFYAIQTLMQIIDYYGGRIPCMTIEDYPEIAARGFSLDQSRGKNYTLAELKKIVDLLAKYKLNQFQLYIEHTYLFRNMTEVWRDETPLQANEIMELDMYCKERYIELVPSLASMGHMYKILKTKSFSHLCELENSAESSFSLWDNMRHHTIDVSNENAVSFVKTMILEYMQLFSSDKFNIGADETFDLGKGKSKNLAQKIGTDQLYIDYVKKLCDFLVEHGKTPMFWGDIILKHPDNLSILPEETICLNWGYSPNQDENPYRIMASFHTNQYVASAIWGWDQWINKIEDSYNNIFRLCSYAKKYKCEGILNTEWGDLGYINHPYFAVTGIIYGAAFSWNTNKIEFKDINRQISNIEFKDTTGKYVDLLDETNKQTVFEWKNAIFFYEANALHKENEEAGNILQNITEENVNESEKRINALRLEMADCIKQQSSKCRNKYVLYLLANRGISIWNRIGLWIYKKQRNEIVDQEQGQNLATELEEWFWHYKKTWREISKEGGLQRIEKIIFWYTDLLRNNRL